MEKVRKKITGLFYHLYTTGLLVFMETYFLLLARWHVTLIFSLIFKECQSVSNFNISKTNYNSSHCQFEPRNLLIYSSQALFLPFIQLIQLRPSLFCSFLSQLSRLQHRFQVSSSSSIPSTPLVFLQRYNFPTFIHIFSASSVIVHPPKSAPATFLPAFWSN